MGYSMPDSGSAIDAGKSGAVNGAPLAIGEALGRSVLGPGLGTAIGGIAVASAQSGNERDMLATIAIERSVNELFGGAGGSSADSGRGRM